MAGIERVRDIHAKALKINPFSKAMIARKTDEDAVFPRRIIKHQGPIIALPDSSLRSE